MVLGLFVYADDIHEIDIEFARWRKQEQIKMVGFLYDQQGRRVQTLVNKVHSGHIYSIILDGSTMASNIYFCRLLDPAFR
jgi:hypothetical protein